MPNKELCKAVCTPSLNGYSPNPLYEQGYCPPYMQQQCNADGTMFEEQWEKHQNDIKDFNAQRIFSMSMGFKPVAYQMGSTMPMPPTTAQIAPIYMKAEPTKKKVSSKKKTSKKKSTKKK